MERHFYRYTFRKKIGLSLHYQNDTPQLERTELSVR
jgi:hypothetical protein